MHSLIGFQVLHSLHSEFLGLPCEKWYSILIKRMDSGARLSGFQSWFYHLSLTSCDFGRVISSLSACTLSSIKSKSFNNQ